MEETNKKLFTDSFYNSVIEFDNKLAKKNTTLIENPSFI